MWNHYTSEGTVFVLYLKLVSSLLYEHHNNAQVTTKDGIAQELLAYEALFRISTLLNHFKEGLRKTGMLKLIMAFPDLFEHLFTYSGVLTATDVLCAVYVDSGDELAPTESIVLHYLQQYLRNSSEEGKDNNLLCQWVYEWLGL